MMMNPLTQQIPLGIMTSPKKISIEMKGTESDDVALLLDSIPDLDAIMSISRKIGHGTFSSVYLGRSKQNFLINGKCHFAIKHIIPTSHPSRVYMELKCLKLLGGRDNIIEATICLRNLNHIVLIMPYFPHDSFMDYIGKLSSEEICDYLYNLFLALKKVHSYNIIHRDIKPANFLYSRKQKRYALIDFGLAQEVGKYYDMHSKIPKPGNATSFFPPLLDTPHIPSTNNNVKRKLAASNATSSESFSSSAKKLCQMSPAACSNDYIFSPNSARLGSSFVRRSPRKLPNNLVKSPHKKENFPLTPSLKETKGFHINDSPGKHTRFSESVKMSCGKVGSLRESVSTSVKDCSTPKCVQILRRSPRKAIHSIRQKSFVRGHDSSFGSLSSRNTTLDGFKSIKDHSCTAASVSGYSHLGTTNSASSTLGSCRRSSLQEVKTKSGRSILRPSSCSCYGSARICAVCLGRKNEHAPRAGTPGFRAPEVLLRHHNQTTAVDMWSVGVILLCLLSERYPFFRAVDDLSSLSEITTILGTQAMKKAAAKIEKLLTCSENRPALDLRKICERLHHLKNVTNFPATTNNDEPAGTECFSCKQPNYCICLVPPGQIPQPQKPSESCPQTVFSSQLNTDHLVDNQFRDITVQHLSLNSTESNKEIVESSCTPEQKIIPSYPSSLYHLLYRLLDPNPDTRITAEGAMNHPFILTYYRR